MSNIIIRFMVKFQSLSIVQRRLEAQCSKNASHYSTVCETGTAVLRKIFEEKIDKAFHVIENQQQTSV